MIRNALPAEAGLLKKLHRASIEHGCSDFYAPDQIDAWTLADVDAWANMIANSPCFIVSELEGSLAGFGSLRRNNTIWHLYVSPAHMGRGIGSQLLEALERELTAKGVKRFVLESSLNAIPFYEHRQYQKLEPKTLRLRGVEIEALEMAKAA